MAQPSPRVLTLGLIRNEHDFATSNLNSTDLSSKNGFKYLVVSNPFEEKIVKLDKLGSFPQITDEHLKKKCSIFETTTQFQCLVIEIFTLFKTTFPWDRDSKPVMFKSRVYEVPPELGGLTGHLLDPHQRDGGRSISLIDPPGRRINEERVSPEINLILVTGDLEHDFTILSKSALMPNN